MECRSGSRISRSWNSDAVDMGLNINPLSCHPLPSLMSMIHWLASHHEVTEDLFTSRQDEVKVGQQLFLVTVVVLI